MSLPVTVNTSTWSFVTVPNTAATASLLKNRVRSIKPSGPAVVQEVELTSAPVNGVDTSSRAERNGDTPCSLTDEGSTLVTSKVAVPRMATGRTPSAPTFSGFGQP